jgi:hypothetical protein
VKNIFQDAKPARRPPVGVQGHPVSTSASSS